MQGELIDAAVSDRFLRDWQRHTGSGAADRALIAISGGVDSSALLLLFAAIKGAVTPPIAATVDHGLRERSAEEAALAGELCRSHGVAHAVLRRSLPDRSGSTANLSARARDLRYALLAHHAEETGARWIVTAHHADDQLETVIMRLNRGSGVRGLAAIRGRTGAVVRPLLTWRRIELSAIVAAAGVAAVDDPSNTDRRFARARLRSQLAQADWLDAAAAARSAAALAETDEAIEWSLDRLADERCRFEHGRATLNPLCLPAEFQRRLTERCLRHVDPDIVLRGDEMGRLLDLLRGDRPATLGNVRCDHAVLDRSGPVIGWTFDEAPPRNPPRRL